MAQAALIADPTGDTLGSGTVQHDIVSVNLDVVSGNLVIEVHFAGVIAAPSAFVDGSVVGTIDLDLDQSAATGVSSLASTGLGVEYFLDLFTEGFNPGFVQLVEAASLTTVADVPISFGPTSLSLIVPLADLGGDDGQVELGITAGTYAELTDTAASIDATTSEVPEPASMLVWCVALAGLSVRILRRRDRRK